MVSTNKITVKAPVGDLEATVEDLLVKVNAPIPSYLSDQINIGKYLGVKSEVGNPHFLVNV